VDEEHFGLMQAWMTGTDGGAPAGCECVNRDDDDTAP